MHTSVLLYYHVCEEYIREILRIRKTVIVNCRALLRTQVWTTAQPDDITALASQPARCCSGGGCAIITGVSLVFEVTVFNLTVCKGNNLLFMHYIFHLMQRTCMHNTANMFRPLIGVASWLRSNVGVCEHIGHYVGGRKTLP